MRAIIHHVKLMLNKIANRNYLYIILLSLVCVFLLVTAWRSTYSGLIAFIMYIPILMLEKITVNKFRNIFYFSTVFSIFILYQLLSLSWIKDINLSSYCVACIINSIFLSLPFYIYRLQYKNNLLFRLVFLSVLGTSLEYILLQWEFAFPYFNNGYLLCFVNEIIQWYKVTGMLGGTLWIFLVNGVLYSLIYYHNKLNIKSIIALVVIMLIPVIYSIIDYRYNEYNNNITKDFVSLQSNTSRYNYKYEIPPDSLTEYYISNSKKEMNDFTELLIWPETALTEYINQDSIGYSNTYKLIKNNLLEEYSSLTLISGGFIDTITYLSNIIPKTEYEKLLFQTYRERKRYNTALYFDNSGKIDTYFKNKLVPFEEYTPYARCLNKFKSFFKSPGGFEFSPNFNQKDNFSFVNRFQLIPVICYESLFGEYIAKRTQQIHGIIIVISSEGWMNDTEASNHFLRFSIARAIENKRSIIRSCNFGVSSLIDPKGRIIQSVSIGNPSVVKGKAVMLDDYTFYSKFGDWIGILSFVLVLLMNLFQLLKKP